MANNNQEEIHSAPLIAVDMDDVLAMTAVAVTDWHNKEHGTSITLDDCHYFHFWKNKDWGTRSETRKKLDAFHRSERFKTLQPVPSAAEGLKGLKSLGFRFKIVTARSHEYREVTEAWVAKTYPDVFDEILFTSTYAVLDRAARSTNPWAGKTKAEVIKGIGAVLLIDDSLENATICAKQDIHVLLFGDYPWGTRHSGTSTPEDLMSRAERIKAGDDGFWDRDVVAAATLPPLIRRVGGWEDVVEWVRGEGAHVVRHRTAMKGPPLEELEGLGESVRVL